MTTSEEFLTVLEGVATVANITIDSDADESSSESN